MRVSSGRFSRHPASCPLSGRSGASVVALALPHLGCGLPYFAVLAGVAAPWMPGVILAPAAQAWRAGVAA
jgi:hypothetical protein